MQWDLSDVEAPGVPPIDGLNAALDVATEVLIEYGGEGTGRTRIERLSRYLVFALGDPDPRREVTGPITRYQQTGGALVARNGDQIRVTHADVLTPHHARVAAQMLLRAAEEAEAA